MECLNCGFENIPGTPTCVRCQSVLNVGEVGVIPRRASSLRLVTRLLRAWYWVSARLPTFIQALPRWRPVTFERVPWPALAVTLIVPGLGHIGEGHLRLGRLLLGLWLACLLAAIGTVASPLSIWCLMGAITVHAAALISLQAGNLAYERILVRLLFGVLLFLGLQWLVYIPITRAAEHVVVPLQLVNFRSGPVLSNGDGILYEGPWLRPTTFARGELVVYRIGPVSGHGFYIEEGFGVDRVIGLPGERVEFRDGVLLINGAPLSPPVAPLAAWIFARLDLTLGPSEYAIVPSQLSLLLPHAAPGAPPAALRPLTVITGDRILGRVVLRVQPWWHAGRVH